MKGNLTMINGGGKKNDAKEIVTKLRDELQYTLEIQMILAQLTRAKYIALVNEGFTEAQALELSKTL